MRDINGKTRTCGLIGNPVEHTLSPIIHNTLASELGIDMAYVPFHVETGQLEHAAKGAYALNILGCNVTVPYKNDIVPQLVEIDDLAAKIGSVNTLVRVEGGYKGYNTDMTGLLRAMKSDNVTIEGEEIIVLGAGGVGRAVAYMCAAYGASKVYLLNRTLDKAVNVAREVNENTERDCVEAFVLSDYKTLAKKKYVVIQCTSIGLYPKVEDVVIEDESFYDMVKVGYDLIYTPWETKFMSMVKAHGAQAYNGLKMLLYQGVDAFELWNDCKVSDESAYKVYELMKEAVTSR
ncbi:MAG: shikimate dehydrogenase [Lachnospiraceae bacterium]|nr:shikimate dehydrogenase [Lachnospiraceae bacterium]